MRGAIFYMDTSTDTALAALVEDAQLYCDKGLWTFARRSLEELFEKGHRPAFTARQLGDVCAAEGYPQQSIKWHRQAIALEPASYKSYENLIFTLDAQATTTEAEATAARVAWWNQFGGPAYAMRQPYTNWLNPDRRIRVGYVSGDFNFHSAAIAWTNVVANHTSRIEPVLYSTLEPHRYDNRTRLWQDAFGDHFVDVSGQSAHELALTIHRDQVDILVDLSGYTNNNRLMTFAYAPAPIRIQAWGYVQGAASPMFTHLFADPIVATPEIRAHLSETVVDLPSILSYLPPSKASGDQMDYPCPTPLPCLSKPPVFCVFQRASKITDDCIATWRAILEILPDATIMFKGADYSPVIRTRIANGFGPTQRQITFDFHTSHAEHLLWYQDADLSLDPWPQTGGVSTLEGFWMHTPCVTLLGDRMIQRTSASFLTTLGLEDFIATTHEEYVRAVVSLVTTRRERLNDVRQHLREKFAASPIISGYVGHVEAAYRTLWREYVLKETETHGT